MIIYFNLFITLLCGWAILFLNNAYLQPALINKKRFQLFKIRDELSLLAMRRELAENSEEYRVFIKLLNATIGVTSSFRVTDFLKYLYEWYNDEREQEAIYLLKEKMCTVDNHEYCELFSRYFSVTHDIYDMQTRTLRFVFFPLIRVLSWILALLKITTEPQKKVQDKSKTINDIDKKLHNLIKEFSHRYAAA